ncbi:DUF6923 family protein [Actinocrispum wychmicini]|uniref:DUF6923 domain-containing protein n=1 Tax=Actinocrispum wychmicini TaxID=1213861 RepID=A0A4R2JE29_9PSEU|nr:hypothetical protein [Actinocrispum wychmicini]TCO52505.1 hypothetical protein EV192_112237 [Actinocrispum wychmicini]
MTVRRWSNVTLAAVLLMGSGLVGSTPAAAADGACDAFEVYTPRHGSSSTLVRLDLPSGQARDVRTFADELNGIGYAASQNLLYGISTKSHVVTINPGGAVVDRGKVFDVGDATAGAISGSTLFLRDGGRLLSLDIDPKSPTYLRIIHVKWLSWFADVDDFDFGSDGLLYGVTSSATVVTIDPLHGTVHTVARPKALPNGTYGAILMAPGRILYAINNRVGSSSRLYRIPLADPQAASEVASFPAADATDAAGCLPPPPVIEPPTSNPPTPTQPPPPAPAPPKLPAPVRKPLPTTPSTTPPPSAQPVTQPSQSPPATTPHKPPPPSRRPVAAPVQPDTPKKRRWALTTLVLVLGGGAAVGATVRNRHR